MEEFTLREMEENDKNEVLNYLKEFAENGSELNGFGSNIEQAKDFEELYKFQQEAKTYKFIGYEQEGRSPTIGTFLLVRNSDHRIVANFNLRFPLTKFLDDNQFGNIGYSVRPSERRKGYATLGLKMLLEKCKELKFPFVRIGCKSNNIGSKKVILKNGGKLIAHKDLIIPHDYYEINL